VLRRCVLLFARSPGADARAKRIGMARPVFAFAALRIRRAARILGIDCIVADKQRGATFGERFKNAFLDARALGYGAVVAVPQDVPGIDAAVLARAFSALTHHDVVLGPSTDGGAYLIGATRPIELFFDRIRWRTPDVLSDLLAVSEGAAVLLRSLSEIDGRRDLRRWLRARPFGGDREIMRVRASLKARPEPARVRAFMPAFFGASPAIRGPPSVVV
jgi:glycosyltransferase A (GT-A) superfamily protein (DUF2064 family)